MAWPASPGMSWSASAPPASGGGGTEARTDLAVLEGAGQYVRARERAAALNARLGEQAGAGVRFGVDVVYTDGCRMPW